MAEFVSKESMSKIDKLGSSGDYLKYARKWTIDPEPDKSGLIKTLGQMIDSAAGVISGVANYQEKSLDREISDRINAERAAEVSQLENVQGTNPGSQATLDTPPPATSNAQGAPNQNMFQWGPQEDTEKPVTPEEEKLVSNAVGQAERMRNAAEQGKNPEHYYGRVYHWAKQRRAELPPHLRKRFDDKLNSTANQYLTDLRTKQNQLATQGNDKYNKAFGVIDDLAKEDPKVLPLLNRLLNKQVTPEDALNEAQVIMKPIIDKNVAERNWATIKANDAIGQHTASERFRTLIASEASTFANVTYKTLGLDNPDEVMSKISRIQAGKDKASQEQINQYGNSVNAYATQLEQTLFAKARERNAAGLDYYAMKDAETVNKEIAQAVAPYRAYAKQILGDNPNMAQFNLLQMKAVASDNGRKLAEANNLVGQSIRTMNALDAGMLGNPNAMNAIIAPAIMSTPGLQGEMRTMVTSGLFNAAAQTRVPPENGQPITLQGSISALRSSGYPTPVGAAMALEQINLFNNPTVDAESKQGLAMYYYHTQNLKLLNEFNKEQRARVFNTLTNKDTIDSIWEATKGRDDLRGMVSNWGRHVFGQEFLRTELKDLSTLQMPEGVQIRYDDKTSTLVVDESKMKVNPTMRANPLLGDPSTAGAVGGQNPALINLPKIKEATAKINQAIGNIKHIATKSNEDPNVWIMEGLRMGGLNVDYNRIWADPRYENKGAQDGKKAP